ncbi:hypothetical protein [Lactococcus lactis]|uniref:hypothetical protein n=1 Tax=Lactococcus lactis TaxID=1358 RepID=UPI003D16D4B5
MEIIINEFADEYTDEIHLLNKLKWSRNHVDGVKALTNIDIEFYNTHIQSPDFKTYYTAKTLKIDGCSGYAIMQYKNAPSGADESCYSKIGWNIHQLKYHYDDIDADSAIIELFNLVEYNINLILSYEGINDFYLIPAPSFTTDFTKKVPYLFTDFFNNNSPQAELSWYHVFKTQDLRAKVMNRGEEFPSGVFISNTFSDEKPIVIIDDLYGEGATARAVVSAIRNEGNKNKIIFISLTYNGFGGIKKR